MDEIQQNTIKWHKPKTNKRSTHQHEVQESNSHQLITHHSQPMIKPTNLVLLPSLLTFSRSQGNPLKWNRRSNCKCQARWWKAWWPVTSNKKQQAIISMLFWTEFVANKIWAMTCPSMFRLHVALHCLRLYRKSRGERKSDSRNCASRVLGPAPKPQKCDFYFEQCDMPSSKCLWINYNPNIRCM